MPTTVNLDITGAIAKTKALLNLPKAAKYNATFWATAMVQELKRSAANMQKSKGRKTGHMARNIGMAVDVGSTGWKVIIGTGVAGAASVKYARIQDEGGTIRAKGKYLTIPMDGVKGTARNFTDSFVIKSKSGNLMICERKGKDGIRPLFLLKKEVTLPATNWFSGPVEKNIPELMSIMTDEEVLNTARNMAGG